MKKLKFWMLAAAMLLFSAPVTAFAEGEEEVPTEEALYRYGLDMEGNAELYDFLPSDTYTGEVVIPTEIDGHPVDYVGNACFMGAAGITSVTIPANLTDLGDSVFFGCTSLQTIIVEEGNPYYSVKDGVLLADNEGFLVAYPAALEGESYTVPDTVDEIAPGAFGYAKHLKEITVPGNVNYLDSWAFAYSDLEKFTAAEGLVRIDDYAFAYCDALHEVNLSSGLDTISNAAFAYDGALTQITLPSTLTYIGQYAFCGTGLTCVTIPNSLETISYCAFGYDADMNAINEFTIYGEAYSAAESYASAVDQENDYENHFTFVAVADASVPYELGEGMLLEDAIAQEEAANIPTEIDENGDVIVLETDAEGNPVNATEELGAGLKDNQKLQMMLGIGGGIAILLAIILVAAFAKKPKKEAEASEEADSSEEDSEKDGEA